MSERAEQSKDYVAGLETVLDAATRRIAELEGRNKLLTEHVGRMRKMCAAFSTAINKAMVKLADPPVPFTSEGLPPNQRSVVEEIAARREAFHILWAVNA